MNQENIASLLADAINDCNQVLIRYNDDKEERLVNPYYYGVFGGAKHLHGFQINGPSKSGKPNDW